MNTGLLLSLIFSIICAVICYRLAISKNRNPVGWTLLGFFFTIIGLVVVALLPRKPPQMY
jgi:hypothetical protein